jgi:hypothetical protein
MAYSNEPFEKDHRRLLENAATLFVASVTQPLGASPASAPLSPTGERRERIH